MVYIIVSAICGEAGYDIMYKKDRIVDLIDIHLIWSLIFYATMTGLYYEYRNI